MSVSEITVTTDGYPARELAAQIIKEAFPGAAIGQYKPSEEGCSSAAVSLNAEVEPEVLEDTLAKYIAELTANRDDVCASGANNVLSVTRANTVMRRIAEGVSQPR